MLVVPTLTILKCGLIWLSVALVSEARYCTRSLQVVQAPATMGEGASTEPSNVPPPMPLEPPTPVPPVALEPPTPVPPVAVAPPTPVPPVALEPPTPPAPLPPVPGPVEPPFPPVPPVPVEVLVPVPPAPPVPGDPLPPAFAPESGIFSRSSPAAHATTTQAIKMLERRMLDIRRLV